MLDCDRPQLLDLLVGCDRTIRRFAGVNCGAKYSLRYCITNPDFGNVISDKLVTEPLQMRGIRRPVGNVPPSIRLGPIQLAQPLDNEFLGIEVYGIARLASLALYSVQEKQSILIEDEDVVPPAALWIGFLMIDEPMAMLDQDTADPITEFIDPPLFSTANLRSRPPIGWLEQGVSGYRVGGKPDGTEIGQQAVGKGLDVGHRKGI